MYYMLDEGDEVGFIYYIFFQVDMLTFDLPEILKS